LVKGHMLEGLDEVEWSELDGCYRSAADAPHLLRAMTSTDPPVARAAQQELFDNIYHQGTIYQATPAVVPFFAQIARSPSAQNRVLVVLDLGALARGESYLVVHADFHEKRGEPMDEHRLQQEVRWVHEIREAVARECPELINEAERADWAFGTAVAYVAIAVCPEEGRRLVPRLDHLSLGEIQPSRRGALALAGFLLGDRETSLLDDVERAMTGRYDAEEYGRVLEALRTGGQTELEWMADNLLEALVSRGLFEEPSSG